MSEKQQVVSTSIDKITYELIKKSGVKFNYLLRLGWQQHIKNNPVNGESTNGQQQ